MLVFGEQHPIPSPDVDKRAAAEVVTGNEREAALAIVLDVDRAATRPPGPLATGAGRLGAGDPERPAALEGRAGPAEARLQQPQRPCSPAAYEHAAQSSRMRS